MNYSTISTTGLIMMHDGVLNALEFDRKSRAAGRYPKHETHLPDWKRHSTGLETELTIRGVVFEPSGLGG